MSHSLLQAIALSVLKGYKAMVSPWLAPSCRFTPTCSEYARDAIEQYGVLRGAVRTLKRLFRCHPFHKGGWDPA
jgi:putative membrane protein insertion efficiency factor